VRRTSMHFQVPILHKMDVRALVNKLSPYLFVALSGPFWPGSPSSTHEASQPFDCFGKVNLSASLKVDCPS